MEIGNRTWVIVGGSFSILVLLAVANQYEDRAPRSVAKGGDTTLAVSPMTGNAGDGEAGREVTGDTTKVVSPVVSPNEVREEALRVLAEGSESEVRAVLAEVGRPGRARGAAVYAKILELSEQGVLPGELVPGALKRTGGSKAVEPILALLKSTESRTTAAHCAVALQDYGRPGLMPEIIERLDSLGMLEKNTLMPWIDRGLLGSYLEKVEGAGLMRGIKVLRARPSLVKAGLDALKRGLEDADPVTRMASAEAIKNAVASKRIGAGEGRGLLAGRLDRETEPVLRAEITGGIEVAQRLLEVEPVLGQP